MKRFLLAISLLALFSINALASDADLISKPSKYSVAETLNRLEAVVKAKGITVFARVDHSGDAEKVGLKLRPTQLLIFGNPKAGTPLMISAQSVAIDLPLKALAWEDASGKVWISYNSPAYLQQRHGFNEELIKNVAVIAGLVDQALE
jgi:uncharacterized protein (DUF302 family)